MAARKKIPDPAYFARRLGAFLREHHPLLEKTEGMVRERSRRAWVSAWDALQSCFIEQDFVIVEQLPVF